MKRHPDLERYLKLATWGVSGQARTTLKLELESHVIHKAWKYEVAGLNENAAITKALEDLGQPLKISAGMTEVYTMPNLIRTTLLASVLIALGVTTLNSSAQIATTSRLPIEPCLKSAAAEIKKTGYTIYCNTQELWLRVTDLKTLLEPKGIKIQKLFTKSNDVVNHKWSFNFPGSKRPIFIMQQTGFKFTEKSPSFDVSNEYVSATTFVEALKSSDLPVSITGWQVVNFKVGETQFSFGTVTQVFNGETLYGNLIQSELFVATQYKFGIGRETPYYSFNEQAKQRIHLANSTPNIYALIRLDKDWTTKRSVMWLQPKPLSESGLLEFTTDNRPLNLVKRFEDLRGTSWKTPHTPLSAILVKFGVNLKEKGRTLEIVDPNSVLVQPTERLIAKNVTPSSFCEGKGAVNSSLAGKWTGEFTTTNNEGKSLKGRISSIREANGFSESKLENPEITSKGILIGTACNNGSTFGSYRYGNGSNLTSRGKMTMQPDGSVTGSSEERNSKNTLIGKTTFTLKRQ